MANITLTKPYNAAQKARAAKMQYPIGSHYVAYFVLAPTARTPDADRQAAAERKRRRKRARNLGHPHVRADTILLDDDVLETGDFVMLPEYGWGFVNPDEVGHKVGTRLAARAGHATK